MRRMKILAKALTDDEVNEAIELLKDAGFAADEIEVVNGVGDPTPDCDDELALVVLSEAMSADPGLEQELAKLPNGGRRAICVWPKTPSEAAVAPAAAHKYGYSIIPWDAAKLGEVASDDDASRFETPTGEPLLPPEKLDRNLCVEEEAKPK